MTATATKFQTGHVGLNVTDLARSIRFYEEVFGFQTVRRSEEDGKEYAFLAQGSTLVLTLWRQSEGGFAARLPGLHHLSFQVDSIDDVQAAEQRLRAAGATVLHGGIVAHAEGADSGGLFFQDPDGIRLEIFAPSGAAEFGAVHAAAPTCGFF